MKHNKSFAWMMAIAIASIMMTACSLDGYEPEKPFTTCPPPKTMLFACSFTQPEIHAGVDVLFNEDDIEWFNVTTREIKFREMEEPLYKRLEPFHEIYFYLGTNELFVVSSFVGDWDSMVYTNLVLHYDVISDPNQATIIYKTVIQSSSTQKKCKQTVRRMPNNGKCLSVIWMKRVN